MGGGAWLLRASEASHTGRFLKKTVSRYGVERRRGAGMEQEIKAGKKKKKKKEELKGWKRRIR